MLGRLNPNLLVFNGKILAAITFGYAGLLSHEGSTVVVWAHFMTASKHNTIHV